MAYKQFYLLPMDSTSLPSGGVGRWPKYMQSRGSVGFKNWKAMDYGNEPFCICCANLEAVDHATLAANSDVFQFPVDLSIDVQPSDLAQIRAELKGRNFPSLWVNSPGPYSGVVRNIAKCCLVLQRFQGRFQSRLFDDGDIARVGVTLNAKKRGELDTIAYEHGIVNDQASTLEVQIKDMMEKVPTVSNRGKPLALYGINL